MLLWGGCSPILFLWYLLQIYIVAVVSQPDFRKFVRRLEQKCGTKIASASFGRSVLKTRCIAWGIMKDCTFIQTAPQCECCGQLAYDSTGSASLYSTESEASICLPNWTFLEHTGKCYFNQATWMSWMDAKASCEAFGNGSTLASVHDSTEMIFIEELTGAQATWLGAHDIFPEPDQSFKYTDGTFFDYRPWYGSGPDGISGALDGGIATGVMCLRMANRRFHDRDCGALMGSVCQYKPNV